MATTRKAAKLSEGRRRSLTAQMTEKEITAEILQKIFEEMEKNVIVSVTPSVTEAVTGHETVSVKRDLTSLEGKMVERHIWKDRLIKNLTNLL